MIVFVDDQDRIVTRKEVPKNGTMKEAIMRFKAEEIIYRVAKVVTAHRSKDYLVVVGSLHSYVDGKTTCTVDRISHPVTIASVQN